MSYTYVLQSEVDNNFYVGFTQNLKLRFEEHEKGLVESTRDRLPFRLVCYESCIDREDATRREKYLKTYHGRMFLRKRLKSYLTTTPKRGGLKGDPKRVTFTSTY